MIKSNLEELITPLRIQIGDTVKASEVYEDDILHEILRHAVNALMPRWSNKYYIDNDGVATRNDLWTYKFSSPPEVQRSDHRVIVLQASIMIKSGTQFSSSGDAVSWRDEEFSYSNIESAKQKSSALKNDVDELEGLLPKKKLAQPVYGRLHGYTD